jgi:GTP diphosphokinase / guanosine-3',5'-bis(diphosphate) 3'-diphosphatase
VQPSDADAAAEGTRAKAADKTATPAPTETAAKPRHGDPDATQPLSAADEPSSGFGLASAPTGRRVRARLARFNAPWQSTQVSEVLEPLIATHRASHPKADGRAL